MNDHPLDILINILTCAVDGYMLDFESIESAFDYIKEQVE